MGYIEENLIPGEHIVMKSKVHWIVFIQPAVYLFMGFLFLFMIRPNQENLAWLCLASVFIVAGVLSAIKTLLIVFTTEFGLTDKRVIGKSGLIRRKSLEILLNKVESIGVSQPLLGRALNYGTIVVSGSGGTKQSFPTIAGAMELRQEINQLINAYA